MTQLADLGSGGKVQTSPRVGKRSIHSGAELQGAPQNFIIRICSISAVYLLKQNQCKISKSKITKINKKTGFTLSYGPHQIPVLVPIELYWQKLAASLWALVWGPDFMRPTRTSMEGGTRELSFALPVCRLPDKVLHFLNPQCQRNLHTRPGVLNFCESCL